MVLCARALLAEDQPLLREARGGLPDGLLVARAPGPVPGQHPGLQVHPAARGPGLDQCRHCALGPGRGLVQQHRLERGAPARVPVPAGSGEVRVERGEKGQVHRPHDPRVLERGPQFEDHRPRLLQDDQTLFAPVHEAHPDPEGPAGVRGQEDLVPEPPEGRAGLLLQRVRRGGVQPAVRDQREQHQEDVHGSL